MLHRIALAALVSSSIWAQAPSASFTKGAYPVLEKAGCRSCHNMDGVAAGTRLLFPEGAEIPAERLEAFGKSLVTLVDRLAPEKSLLLAKPTARVAHVGGQKIKPGSPEEAALLAWIQVLARLNGDDLATAMRYREEQEAGGGHAAPKVELRRLTHSQYNNTVRDLLGDLSKPADRFPPEDFVNGFRNQIQAQSLSPLLIENYSAAAEKVALSAMRGGDTRGLLTCKAATPACRTKFVREFGLRTFRRPLEPAEQKRYEALMAMEKDLIKGTQLVIEAMLQSSNFLFRLEDTSEPKWKQYATASRLSYALWDSMPDATLFAAAEKGELATPRGIESQVRRMLDNPKAKQALDEFTGQWLRFDRILTSSKDRRKYPQFTRETAVAMTQEARLFVSDLVWNDKNFMELFTAPYGFVNSELAGIYGVPTPPQDFAKVNFQPASERAGILGQALFLAATAKPEDSSPTARGLFVREVFLCQHVPDPPAGVNTNLPPFSAAKPQTNRDRLSEHVTNPGCAACHSLIDPIGFGLEKFDAVGARRDKFTLKAPRKRGEDRDKEEMAWSLDIDPAGFVAGIPNSKFASPSQLGKVLANSNQCQECVAKQYFRYTYGRAETAADRPVIRKMTDDFKKSDFKFKELILSLMLQREIPGGPVHAARNHQPR
ncbi:MAG: DUF1592 domain-containing protein [Bryobacterales bacterium]|nr:DUF1592 domain-containing protein [Bryobacterales bacterium]